MLPPVRPECPAFGAPDAGGAGARRAGRPAGAAGHALPADGTVVSARPAEGRIAGLFFAPAPPAAAEGLPAALRALYQAETGLARGCAGAAETLEDECFRQRLSVLSREAAERAKQVDSVVENSLTTGNNLLKW